MSGVVIERMRRHFSAHAAEYDRYAQVQKRVVTCLLDHLESAGAIIGPILDLGVGTGELAQQLTRRYPDHPLLVADIAHGMSCCAKTRLPNALALDADALALPLRAASCGLVVSSSMYQWVGDLPRAFREVQRILRPGGSFVFALFGAATLQELRASHQAALASCGGGQSHMQSFPTAAAVQAALDSAGLSGRVTIAYESEHYPDVATLLRSLKRIGAQNVSDSGPGGLGGRQVTLRMLEFYGERYGDEQGIPVTWEVLYGVAQC